MIFRARMFAYRCQLLINKMNKAIFQIVAILILALPLYASPKVVFDISDEYMISLIGVNSGGVKIVSVTTYGKNERDATERAKMDAVAGTLFRGIPAGGAGLVDVPSLLNVADYDNNLSYFQNFFDSGKYLRFVNEAYDSTPAGTDNMQRGKKRRVGVVLEVLRDKLAEQLVADGVMTTISDHASALGGSKPVMMVIPDPEWMTHNGLGTDDFRKALSNSVMRNCIGEIGGYFSQRGYPLVSLEGKLDELANSEVRRSLATGIDGSAVQTDMLEELSGIASCDIFLKVGFSLLSSEAGRDAYNFRIEALDMTSLKTIHFEDFQTSPSAAPAHRQLKQSNLAVLDKFFPMIERHMKTLSENGREVYLDVMLTEDSPLMLDDEVSDGNATGTLQEAIYGWVRKNAQNGIVSRGNVGRTRMVFDSVRIPLMYTNGFSGEQTPQHIIDFASRLGSYLKRFGLSARVNQISAGKADIIIGSL